jgi:diaminopropionate ammonia-lyase
MIPKDATIWFQSHRIWRLVRTVTRFFPNPHAGDVAGLLPGGDPLAFHARLPGYAPTPLVAAPGLAEALGVGQVWVKDESSRLGLPSFKILGASWATYRALATHLGHAFAPWDDLQALALQLASLLPLTLVAATDGNHGRAVARMAALLDLDAHVLVPAGTAQARIQAIAAEGATVEVVDGSYDQAVTRSAAMADTHHLVISDTSWPGYEEVPRWVIEGYSTIFQEVGEQLAARGEGGPELIGVQIGVGALAAALVTHYRAPGRQPRPAILGAEPSSAACVLASMAAGRPITIPCTHASIMAGLNCGTPSLVAWPLISRGIDLFVAIEDEWARWGMRALAADGVVAGETGAAGLAGLAATLRDTSADQRRAQLGITAATRVLLLATEGATDPDAYHRIVGAFPPVG